MTALAAGEELVEGQAYHQADELFGIEFRGWRGLDVMPVPEHGDSVGDLEYLLQPVGYIHHTNALSGEVFDDTEELAGLSLRQGKGRLFHDHRPRPSPGAPPARPG